MTSPEVTPPDTTENGRSLTVVGIGASAGGLSALKTFFSNVPADSGLSYVVVVHLSPEQKSHLADLLQPHACFPILQITETTLLEPNRGYIIPPGANLNTIDTHLRLSEPDQTRGHRTPVDHFFRTLASTHDGHAIGVILTGTGSDGALGIKEIKGNGGLVIVQDPKEAEYDGMPQSAISTGMADLVLPVEQIPAAVLRYARTAQSVGVLSDDDDIRQSELKLLYKVFARLREITDRDFSRFKRSTIMRRIARRMQLTYIVDLKSYVDRLGADPEEVRALADDLLITVTNFFRDAEVFKKLETEVIPRLFADKTAQDSLRVWSVGCATGEEAYSIAMLLLEETERREPRPAIQIFASDLHKASLEKARDGFYPGDIASDVSAERLQRFFQRENGGYRLRKEVRELCVFASHNLLSDPPFSRLDLIVCRNLLIYFERAVRGAVLELFHFALNPDATLILGSTETIETSELFRAEDKSLCIYRKHNVRVPEPRLPVSPPPRRLSGLDEPPLIRQSEPVVYGTLHQRLVELYAPPSLLISSDDKVVHLSEHSGHYLTHPGGEPTANVFKLMRDELRIELRALLPSARKRKEVLASRPIPLQLNGHLRQVVLHVGPAREPEHEGFILVIFEEREARQPNPAEPEPPGQSADHARIAELERELNIFRKRTQRIVADYEAGREEMNASNEELQSTNEELRSTMEELETSKEELQSINEELQTVNQENRHKLEELAQLSGDLHNLLSATGIATLFLDRGLRIMRFTPKVTDLFNVLTMDRGRPISDLTHRLNYPQLQADAEVVLNTLAPVEREVQDDQGRWYLTRVLPYRSPDDHIEGVVITFVDITRRVMAETRLRSSEARLSSEFAAMQRLHDLAASLMASPDVTGAMDSVLESAILIAGADKGLIHLLDGSATTMKMVAHRGFRIDLLEQFRALKMDSVSAPGRAWKVGKRVVIEDVETDRLSAPLREMAAAAEYRRVQATPLLSRDGRVLGVLSTFHSRPGTSSERELRVLDLYSRHAADFIEACRSEEELRQSERTLRSLNEALSRSNANLKEFAYAASHDLREPLRTVSAYSELLIEACFGGREQDAQMASRLVLENTRKMDELLTDLLAYTRIIVEEENRRDLVDLNFVAATVIASLRTLIEETGARITRDPLPVMPGRVAYFTQLFQNLIDNAIKYRSDDRPPEIHISAVRLEREWQLSVSDNGIGIQPEYQEYIFQVFKRLHEKETPGTGIGLALCRRVVERSGGRIWVEGEPGRGSIFRIALPAEDEE